MVRVELTDANIDAAITAAALLFNRYHPARKRATLGAGPNGRYDMSTSYPGIIEVIDVVGVRNRSTTGDDSRIDLFDPLLYMPGGAVNTAGVSSYMQATESLEQARRVFSSEVEWTTEWETVGSDRILYLYISTPSAVAMVYGFEYIVGVSPDDSAVGVKAVTPDMHDWFVRYVTSKSRHILGRALRKFQGVPGPDGSDLQLDGTDLVTDAENELSVLEDQIVGSRTSFPLLIS